MFSSFFNPESWFWREVSRITDVMVLSLLWLFCSLPVVTLGAATAALYDATVKCVRGGEQGAIKRFFRTFRRELFVASVTSLVWLLWLAVLVLALYVLWAVVLVERVSAAVAVAISFLILLVPMGAFCWMFPLLSRFTLPLFGLSRTAVRMALAYLPYTAIIVALTIAVVVGSIRQLIPLMLLPLLIAPCLTVLVWSLMMERAFRKYMPEEEPSLPSDEEK